MHPDAGPLYDDGQPAFNHETWRAEVKVDERPDPWPYGRDTSFLPHVEDIEPIGDNYVLDRPRLSAGARAALTFIRDHQARTNHSHCDFREPDVDETHHMRFCGGLVRKGLLTPMEQGQNPIHEPAIRWTVWAITDAGKAAIEETIGQPNGTG